MSTKRQIADQWCNSSNWKMPSVRRFPAVNFVSLTKHSNEDSLSSNIHSLPAEVNETRRKKATTLRLAGRRCTFDVDVCLSLNMINHWINRERWILKVDEGEGEDEDEEECVTYHHPIRWWIYVCMDINEITLRSNECEWESIRWQLIDRRELLDATVMHKRVNKFNAKSKRKRREKKQIWWTTFRSRINTLVVRW